MRGDHAAAVRSAAPWNAFLHTGIDIYPVNEPRQVVPFLKKMTN